MQHPAKNLHLIPSKTIAMKNLVITATAFLLSAFCMHGQYVPQDSPRIERQGKYLVYEGQKLSADAAASLIGELQGTDMASSWAAAYGKYKKGKILLSSFGGVTVLGAALIAGSIIWIENYNYDGTCLMGPGPFITMYAGYLATLTGIGGLTAGAIIYAKAGKRLDRIIDRCNSGDEYRTAGTSVSVGAQKNGIGIALNF